MDVSALDLTLKVDETLEFELKDLAQGTHGITCAFGKCLAEAAGVCLEEQEHSSPKTMKISGEAKGEAQLKWENTTDQMRRCWNDDEVATEHGAYGIATLLVPQISNLEVVERSKKGTGFDYWLGSGTEDEPLFQKKARLEVSGFEVATRQPLLDGSAKNWNKVANHRENCRQWSSWWNSVNRKAEWQNDERTNPTPQRCNGTR